MERDAEVSTLRAFFQIIGQPTCHRLFASSSCVQKGVPRRADLLRHRLVSSVHIPARETRIVEGLLEQSPALRHVRSLPGMGPILAAVVVSEIDGIERFPSAHVEAAWVANWLLGLSGTSTNASERLHQLRPMHRVATYPEPSGLPQRKLPDGIAWCMP
jgi:hypothetical protein